MADPAQTVSPGLIKSHADRRHLVAGTELWGVHRVQSFALKDPLAVQRAAVQQGLSEPAHVRSGGRKAAGSGWSKHFETQRRLVRTTAVPLGWQFFQVRR